MYKAIYKKNFYIFIYLTLFFIICIISLKIGIETYSFSKLYNTLFFLNENTNSTFIIHEVRIPRIIIGAFCGMLFAISGCILQTVFHNPMAAPDILGINAASSFFLLINFCYFSNYFYTLNIYFSVLGALIGFTIALLFTLESRKISPIRLVIVGIACGVLFKALCQFLIMQTNEKTSALLKFIAGSLYHANWDTFKQIIIPGSLFLFLAFIFQKKLDILLLNETESRSIGFATTKWKFIYILLALCLSAVAVAGCGSLGFVGLISPNIAKLFFGNKHSYSLIGSALVGANITILSDFLGRNIYHPYEIPVGLMTIVLGVPYFIILLNKSRKNI